MTRIEKEKEVVERMIGIYCRRKHRSASGCLCDECYELLAYARRRLDYCPKGDAKSSCRKCEIHCYSAANRERIREVMRYVGPRMMLIDPVAALSHLIREMS